MTFLFTSMEEPFCSNHSIDNVPTGSGGIHYKPTQSQDYYNGALTLATRSENHKNLAGVRLNGAVHVGRNTYKFGGPDLRASYTEHCPSHSSSRHVSHHKFEKLPQRSQSERTNRWVWDDNASHSPCVGLYRSNSSLDLDEVLDEKALGLRREYGSASSIDVISTKGDSFISVLREFGGDNLDLRNAGPGKIVDYLCGKIEYASNVQTSSNALPSGLNILEDASSPKVKSKFQKLWESKEKNKNKNKPANNEISLFRKLRGTKSDAVSDPNKGSDNSLDIDYRGEDKLRRKAFAHYDVQSVTANLSYAAQLRSILSRRRNTTTGASAASMNSRNAVSDSAEDLVPEENDGGDGRSNELVSSCPFFRNELGGEEERTIGLMRLTSNKRPKTSDDYKQRLSPLHKPNIVCGLSVLEGASESYWKKWSCPYQKHNLQMENVDQGVFYYKKYFSGRDHQNWFGIDENLGPVAISICKEKIEDNGLSNKDNSTCMQFQYRIIIRTSELKTLRGSILEDAVSNLKPNSSRGIPAKEILEFVAPELQLNVLRLGVTNLAVEQQLLKLDEQGITNHYKIGIMYCKEGQSTEEEIYNNEHGEPAFEEFLELIGEKVRLKGFSKYRAQLDNKTDSTGLYSVYSTFQNSEIMFHVSTMLPYTPNNRQQLLRKRHIGNDIVTIVFQEPNALPFTPKNIRSHFQHVFIIVRVVNPLSENTRYMVSVTRSKEVPVFGPPIPEGGTFVKSKAFADFLLAKVINAENAAHKSEKFATMATRTRQEYLKDLATNYVSNTTVESTSKFPILSFGGKKKERARCRFFSDACIRGAIVWQVQVEDYGQGCVCHCFLGISADTFILIEETTREPIFVTPNVGILGWSSQINSLKLFYHQGECIALQSLDTDTEEIQEIVSRLCNVTQGCETQEITLRRNNIGQLGFHVQHDGTITEVEPYGFAWQAGLRQGSRLVEICKVVVSSLTHDQMVDLLKTSAMVTVTVIPPLPDGSSRRGCALHNCSYLTSDLLMSDYENLTNCDVDDSRSKLKTHLRHQIAQSQMKVNRNEPNISPPRSSASSGYGSGRSGINADHRFGMINCSSSQSSEEKWYEVGEGTNSDERTLPSSVSGFNSIAKESSPPPLPARLIPTTHSAFSHVMPKRQEPVLSSIQPHHSSSHSYDYGSKTYIHSRGYSFDYKHKQNNSASDGLSEIYSNDLSGNPANYRREHVSSAQHYNYNRDMDKSKPAVLASPAIVISDGHSDSSSDRLQGARSEDDLSGSSNSLSPRCRRRWPIDNWGAGSSGSSSRNQSPRVSSRSGPDGGEAKLRPGISSRGANRNSGLGISTFQEDLLKLINPDLINKQEENKAGKVSDDQPSFADHGSLVPGIKAEIDSSVKNLKTENEASHNTDADVIFTTARPATVISTTSSSPAPSENKILKDDGIVNSKNMLSMQSSTPVNHSMNSHQKSAHSSPDNVPLPEGKEIDWSSLVDTATRAMQMVGVPASQKNCGTGDAETIDHHNLDSKSISRMKSSSEDSIRRIRELETRVKMLENDLERERHRKAALEVEVHSLQEENLRLQEESQTAAAQLRRFTEWFFQTLNRQ